MGVKTLAQEVAEAMGKDAVDDEVIDKASDILKMLKWNEMFAKCSGTGLEGQAERMLAKYKQDGTQELYNKVLLGRRA